jgi:histidyl-tRNA synthetase
LGYYTGPVYEIKLSNNLGSVAGGGRYDNLLELYGQKDFAVGISIGIERLVLLLKDKTKSTTTEVFVASIKGYYNYSLEVAEKLRENNVNAEVDLNERNLKKQFDYANALNIPFVAIVGEKEQKENKITLRNMKSGSEEFLEIKDAIKKLTRVL